MSPTRNVEQSQVDELKLKGQGASPDQGNFYLKIIFCLPVFIQHRWNHLL